MNPAAKSPNRSSWAKREIQAAGCRLQGEGQIKAGVIRSWVAIGVVAASAVLIAVFVIIASVSSSASR
jgi:hypothetical protein